MTTGEVVAVARDAEHRFSKTIVAEIEVVEGLGVAGDAHQGRTVRHRSRVRVDPGQPNLRQVHLIHAELFEEIGKLGFSVGPAQLGENVTTRGVDLLALPRHSMLRIGADVRLRVTGLRNPCTQIENFMPGLLKAVLVQTEDGRLMRKAGIMTVVLAGGKIRAGDGIEVIPPARPFLPLDRV